MTRRAIEIRPCRRFKSRCTAFESKGVEPAFASREEAIGYAFQRLSSGTGEILVHATDGSIESRIAIDGGDRFGN